ncbi:MAG: VOC family protein [Pseudonocardiaceae bacterium]
MKEGSSGTLPVEVAGKFLMGQDGSGELPAYCAVMSERLVPSVRPQPMIAVADVEQTSLWYQHVLGAASGHGGAEYEQLLVHGAMILQLHRLDIGHHHGAIGDPEQPLGNGVAVWFEVDDFDAAVRRIHDVVAEVVADVHLNPNAGHREIWLRDLDGYLVVLAEATALDERVADYSKLGWRISRGLAAVGDVSSRDWWFLAGCPL